MKRGCGEGEQVGLLFEEKDVVSGVGEDSEVVEDGAYLGWDGVGEEVEGLEGDLLLVGK